MSAIGNIASGLLHAVLPTTVRQLGSAVTHLRTAPAPPTSRPPDTGQLSPFGQLVSRLQHLQQSNTAQYQHVTQQIADNLQVAAQKAQAGGNAAAAQQLSLISTDFRNASASGQLPDLQDLAAAAIRHGQHFADTNGEAGNPLSATMIITNTLDSARIAA